MSIPTIASGSNEVIKRSELTKTIFDLLKSTVLLGRGVAPPEGGWPNGTPGSGAFVPYTVLKTGAATTPGPSQPERLGRYRTSWMVAYAVTFHGKNESSVDEYADTVRDQILALPREVSLDGVDWTVQQVQIARMGATERDDSTSPAHWRLTDDVSLHLSRVRTT
ncbi:MAG TPA: hypothetical protein VIT65_22295 [Microlunatus sp.]